MGSCHWRNRTRYIEKHSRQFSLRNLLPIVLRLLMLHHTIDGSYFFHSNVTDDIESLILTLWSFFEKLPWNKKDYLKGVKENVLLGNLIPAGTGYIISSLPNSVGFKSAPSAFNPA